MSNNHTTPVDATEALCRVLRARESLSALAATAASLLDTRVVANDGAQRASLQLLHQIDRGWAILGPNCPSPAWRMGIE